VQNRLTYFIHLFAACKITATYKMAQQTSLVGNQAHEIATHRSATFTVNVSSTIGHEKDIKTEKEEPK
jgi:hypothetical protein